MRSIIKAAGVAALISTLSVGSASAGLTATANGQKVVSISGANAAAIIGSTFVAWTVYRFFQNCGPFTCNS